MSNFGLESVSSPAVSSPAVAQPEAVVAEASPSAEATLSSEAAPSADNSKDTQVAASPEVGSIVGDELEEAVTTAPIEYVGEAAAEIEIEETDESFVQVPCAAVVEVPPIVEDSLPIMSSVSSAPVQVVSAEPASEALTTEAAVAEAAVTETAVVQVITPEAEIAATVDVVEPVAEPVVEQRMQVTKTQAHTVKIKFTPQGPMITTKVPAPAAAAAVKAVVSAPAAIVAKAVAPAPVAVVAKSVTIAPPVESKFVESKAVEAEESTGPLFRSLSLSEDVQKAVEAAGYTYPTEIQAEIIPHVLEGRDVLAQSQTGTGKTAAFALPILSKIDTNRRTPQVLVLAPTRELAMQVCDSFSKYGSHIQGLGVLAIYGGQSYETQLRALRRGVQVVVGTPGRVIDHINRKTLDLSQLECLVLDEADEMLNMGFLDDVQFVLEQTPEGRQVALFSATLPGPIREIAKRYLSDPVRITIKQKTMTAESIRQRAVFVQPRDRVDALVRFLEAEDSDGVIVFTKTREATVTVAEQLCREGRKAVALNGDMAQNLRERTIEQLKNGKLDILVATDVAARGLDVTRISHVFNYDMPHDSESYIHRIGRTGRAGRSGQAIIFLTNLQRGKLRMIERATNQPIQVVEPPTANEINAIRIERFKQQISDVIAGEDLSLFQQMLADYATASKQPIEVIAAALAHIGQQGRSFLMQDRPRRQSFDRDERRGNDRFERGESRDSGGMGRDRGGRQGGERSRNSGPPESGMDRYRIEVGHEDGVKPSNIVGAVANEGGIDGEYIGPIRIHDNYSTIDLPSGMPRDVFLTLQRTRVAGKELNLRLSTDDADHSRPRRSSGPPSEGRRDFRKGPSGSGSFGGKAKSFSKQRRPSGR